MGIGKHETVAWEVLEGLGDFGHFGARSHRDVLGGHNGVSRERASGYRRQNPDSHRQRLEIDVGTGAIDELLTGEERFRSCFDIACA